MKEFEVQTLHKGKRFCNETKHFLKDPNLNSFKLVKLKVLPAKSLKLIWCFTSEGHHFYCINYILQIKKKKKSGVNYYKRNKQLLHELLHKTQSSYATSVHRTRQVSVLTHPAESIGSFVSLFSTILEVHIF